ncbi:hypothetical protein VCHC42A1_3451, partial [Vibrio cholerae HC-42A1]
MNFDFLTL